METNNKLREIKPDDLKEASRGIHYRYFQFRNCLLVLPYASLHLSNIYKNALIESCMLNLRCLLEFFNSERKSREKTKGITGSVYFEHYFNPTKDKIQYEIIKNAWTNNFIEDSLKHPIKFKYKDDFTKKVIETSINEIIEMIHSHLAHQGVWIIQSSQKKGGRISRKISNWFLEQYLPGISKVLKIFSDQLKQNKPELIHEYWNNVKEDDYIINFPVMIAKGD